MAEGANFLESKLFNLLFVSPYLYVLLKGLLNLQVLSLTEYKRVWNKNSFTSIQELKYFVPFKTWFEFEFFDIQLH